MANANHIEMGQRSEETNRRKALESRLASRRFGRNIRRLHTESKRRGAGMYLDCNCQNRASGFQAAEWELRAGNGQ